MVMNAAQLHLALTHVPVVGVFLGLVVVLWGVLSKNPQIRKVGLVLLVFSGLAAIPTFLSGEGAEEIVEDKTGVVKSMVHEHEEAGEAGLISILTVGGLALVSLLWARIKKAEAPVALIGAVLVASLVSTVILARTAHLGGMIRHDEIRPKGVLEAASPVMSRQGNEDHSSDAKE